VNNMNISLLSALTQGGYNSVPPILAKTIGLDGAYVLSEIAAELNHAQKKKLTYNCDNFLCDFNRMANRLGYSFDELMRHLHTLEDYKFIDIFNSNIEDTHYIRVYPENIIKFKEEQEQKHLFVKWDDGLYRSQNPIHKQLHFNKSTLYIKDFFDNHLKTPESIPLILYVHLNESIHMYEEKSGCCFTDISNLNQHLVSMVSDKEFDIEKVYDLIDQIDLFSKKYDTQNENIERESS